MKLGLSHPLYNNRFNIMSKYVTTMVTTVTTTLNINLVDGMPLELERMGIGVDNLQFGQIPKAILGPSTHSDNVGATEVIDITGGLTSAGVHSLAIKTAPTYLYTVGDPITLITPGLPGGWHGTLPSVNTNNFSWGNILSNNNYSDMFGFSILNIVGHVSNYATLNCKRLQANTYYRLSIMYKSTNLAGGSASIRLNSALYTPLTTLALPAASDWTEASITFQTADNISEDMFIVLYFALGITADSFQVAGISLTHASYDDSTDYTTNGYSDISMFPALGSTIVTNIHPNTKIGSDIEGLPYLIDNSRSDVLPLQRYKISQRFDNISIDVLQQIKDIILWQNRGYYINYFPELEGLPYYLTGKISIDGRTDFLISDLTYQSFNFTFMEATI